MNRMNIILATVLGSLALGGCGVYKAYESPVIHTEGLYRDYGDTTFIDQGENFVSIPWQELFSDPYLQELIDRALCENTVMLIAYQKAEARGYSHVAATRLIL